MVIIIEYVYATIILHNLCVKTPYHNDGIREDDESDSEDDDETTLDDGLNLSLTEKMKMVIILIHS